MSASKRLSRRLLQVAAAALVAISAILAAAAGGVAAALHALHRPSAHAANEEQPPAPPSEPPPPGAPEPPTPTETDEDLSRRRFLGALVFGFGAAATTIAAIPLVGFLIGPLVRHTPDVFRGVGSVLDWRIGETKQVTFDDPSPLPWAGVTAKSSAYVRRTSVDQFVAFSTHCTHLGCNVRWLDGANLFMCPCHGGVFYSDGTVAAGPPPLPLARFNVRVVNNEVQVETRPLPITGGSLPGAQQRE